MKNKKLSYIKSIYKNIKIYRDGYFNNLGTLFSQHADTKLLVFIDDEKHLQTFYKNKNISCVICSNKLLNYIKDMDHIGICVVEQPKLFFIKFHNYLDKYTNFYGKKFENHIASTAYIHPKAYIENNNVIIKEGAIIEANVTILSNVCIGKNTIIRAGTVVGAHGFQFIRENADIVPVSHVGRVFINNDVEIQGNCCICKDVYNDTTEIGEKTKLSSLVHIDHGVKIGKRCLVAGNATIAKYAYIGDEVWIGPSATISNSILVGNRASIKIGAVVTKDVKENQSVSGNFAIEHSKFISFIKSIR